MRFTPTAFVGSVGNTFVATATGAQSGSFVSGGINYSFLQFTTGSATLNVENGTNVEILLVGGGAYNAGQTGGGGGGVNVISTRLLRGTYTISVGQGGTTGSVATQTSLTGYNLNYNAGRGVGGQSGAPQFNNAGSDSGNCGPTFSSGGGGGGGALQTGSSAFCPPSNNADGANGGQGLTYNFNGTASVYGSGGGGGSAANAFAVAGIGGTNAGNGCSYNQPSTNAINGFGGGGGGERSSSPGTASRGGNGTLIIRYRTN